MSRRNRAFTIVELLTVVVIIGVLVALLVPAVNMAREAARQTKCINNQREIGLAIFQYEIAKRHLPGFVSGMSILDKSTNPPTPRVIPVNWVISLFPYLDRKDIWDSYQRGRSTAVRVERLVCPDDGAAKGVDAPLSYVVNDIYFPNRMNTPPTDKFNKPISSEKSVSQYSSPRQMVMLGERTLGDSVDTIPSTSPTDSSYIYHAGPWTSATWWALTFNWPKPGPTVTGMPPPLVGDVGSTAAKTAGAWPALSPRIVTSSHPSIAILTFMDGHTEKISTETLSSDAQFWNDPMPGP